MTEAEPKPFHHPDVLVLVCNSGEVEKNPQSRSGDISESQVAIGRRCEGGGVCKAERAALGTCGIMYAPCLPSFENWKEVYSPFR